MGDKFDAEGFLFGMFSEPKAGDVTTTTTPPAAAPEPEPTTSGFGRPEDLGSLAEATGEWDNLPAPTPCRRCGDLLVWWDCWGRRHCERCEPSGQRSENMADRAATLRQRNPPRPTAPEPAK